MKKVVLSCFLLIISSLSFVANSSVNDGASAEGGAERGNADALKQANLIIYRITDRSAINYRILVDGKHVGKLKRGEAISLQLSAGEHVITTSDAKFGKMAVVVSEGAVIYVQGEVNKKSRLALTVTEPADTTIAKFLQ